MAHVIADTTTVREKQQRLNEFVVKFVSAFGDGESTFNERVLRWLLKHADVKLNAVRQRVCQLIAGLMSSLSDNAELDESLCAQLIKSMLNRTADRITAIRALAATALTRLQDPTDVDDRVTRRFIAMLSSDNCGDVRRATLCAIAISKASLEAIILRTMDVTVDVRIAAFQILGARVPCRALSIAQRVTLVRNGLSDREQRVRDVALTVIVDHWLATELPADEPEPLFWLLDLLVEDDEESTAEMLVRALVDANKAPAMPPNPLLSDEAVAPVVVADDGALVPSPLALAPAVALYWRVRCEVAVSSSEWALLDEWLPSGAALCRGVLQSAEAPFVQRQLLLIGALMDLKDEAGRRMLSTLLRNMLGVLSTEEQLIAPMTALLAKIHTNEGDFTQIVLEAMSDVKDVLEQYETPEVQAMRVEESERLRANEAQLAKLARKGITEDTADASVQELVQETAELRAKDELRSALEEGTWLRCVSLASTLMNNTSKSTSDPRIGGLRHTILLAVRNANVVVREAGVRAIGLFALIDATAAIVHIPLLVAVIKADAPSVRVCAVKALVDLILLYGEPATMLSAKEAAMGASEDNEAEIADLRLAADAAPLSVLLELLDSNEVCDLRSVTVEGFAKLLFNGRVEPQTKLLSRLLFLLYEPRTALDAHVRQCLAVFVPAYAHTGAARREALAAACAIALPAIAACDGASVADCAGYLLSLLRDGGVDGRCLHADVARIVAEQLYAARTVVVRKEWSKLVSELRLTNGAIARDLLEQLRFIVNKAASGMSARDRLAKRHVDQFVEIVDARCKADGVVATAMSADAADQLGAELASLRDANGLSVSAEKLADGATDNRKAKSTSTAAPRRRKGVTTSRRERNDNEEELDDDSDDEDNVESDSEQSAPDLSSDHEDESYVVVRKEPVPAKTAAPQKENAPSNSRLAGRSGKFGPAKKVAPKSAKKAPPKHVVKSVDSESDEEVAVVAPVANTKSQRAAATARKQIVLSDSEDDDDGSVDSLEDNDDGGDDAYVAAQSAANDKKKALALMFE